MKQNVVAKLGRPFKQTGKTLNSEKISDQM